MNPIREKVFTEIHQERLRQDSKFGEQNHDLFKWFTIHGEEVGEAGKEIIEAFFTKDVNERVERLKKYRTEVIQMAAVAVSMVECLDRGSWIEQSEWDNMDHREFDIRNRIKKNVN